MNPLESLAERGGGGFPNLTEARELTGRRLDEMRLKVSGVPCDPGASVVLFGSWGRRELTDQSDDDWAILVGRGATATPSPVEGVGEFIGGCGRSPGDQGTFAELNESVHGDCRRRVLAGYLDDSVKDYRPPRFLLNDVIRYWRTICVDFVGKERRGTGEKWALRNLKLGLSRKALFASGLLPILSCHRFAATDIGSFLEAAFEAPSIDRIAASFLEFGAVDAGIRAVGAYDAFIGLLNDGEARAELERLSRDEAMESDAFKQGKRLVKDFQQGLLALLFETPLEPLIREYGIF